MGYICVKFDLSEKLEGKLLCNSRPKETVGGGVEDWKQVIFMSSSYK